ncbi:BrnT family toxin [Candidatus Daviesbacteria bacterium]|nr:BrnT family toxin [Candidatus Daviesbacteria bacterium]
MDSAFDFSKLGGFEWDKGNLEHIKKHNINYKECEEAFLNKPLIVNEDETHSQKEERFRVYGRTNKNKLLFMIFTVRSNKIRVISARNQNKKERIEFQEVGSENL